MANYFDYLEWRGDIPFSVDPFNEVDNVILSELAYINYVGIANDEKKVKLTDACDAYFSHIPENQTEIENPNLRKAKIMKELVKSVRFKNTEVCFYVNDFDPDLDIQFAAVTFLLDDQSAFVAFRGTDHSFTGLHDALDLRYLPETDSQRKAIDYLNTLNRLPNYPLRIGGHSKGGNFAVYGSVFCDPTIRDRITTVYSNDGPGFREEIINSEDYCRILPKVRKIIPEASVVGRLMYDSSTPLVIHSTAKGIGQHHTYTWSVVRNHFEYTDISKMGEFLDKSVSDWTDHLDSDLRKSLIDSIFTVLDNTGKESFHEVSSQKRKSLAAVLTGIYDLPDEKRQELISMIRKLIHSSAQNARTEILQLIEKTLAEKIPKGKDRAEN